MFSQASICLSTGGGGLHLGGVCPRGCLPSEGMGGSASERGPPSGGGGLPSEGGGGLPTEGRSASQGVCPLRGVCI